MLFKGKIHVEADARLTAGPLIGGLHDAGAGAGDHLKPCLYSLPGQLFGQMKTGIIGCGAGRAEYSDLAHLAMRAEHLQRLADICKSSADDAPGFRLGFVPADLEQ